MHQANYLQEMRATTPGISTGLLYYIILYYTIIPTELKKNRPNEHERIYNNDYVTRRREIMSFKNTHTVFKLTKKEKRNENKKNSS